MQLRGIVASFPDWYRSMTLNQVKCITPMRPACIDWYRSMTLNQVKCITPMRLACIDWYRSMTLNQVKCITPMRPACIDWYRSMTLNQVKCIIPMRPEACIGIEFLLEHLPVKRKVSLVLKWIRNAWSFFGVQMPLVITSANCLLLENISTLELSVRLHHCLSSMMPKEILGWLLHSSRNGCSTILCLK